MLKGKNGIYNRIFKRLLDIVCSLLALTVFCWLYAIVAVLVRIKLGGPVIFRQPRPGKDEKIFNLYKFRTMTDEKDSEGNLLSDDARLTEFGRFLRSTSLDELPEAVNILKGEMSVVGPRPLLAEYLPYYTPEERHRHDVRPGLTGLAQVKGRNFVDWNSRFAFDAEYIKNISFLFDIKILFMTAREVFLRGNVAENTRAVEGNFAAIRKAETEKLDEKTKAVG